jgi:hypothetical protein
MSVEFHWDNPNMVVTEVTRMLRDRGQAIRAVPDRAVRRGTFELLKLVQANVPKVTSTLVRSITAVVKRISADIVEGKVGTWLEYARYVEHGTGIYGPLKRPIIIAAKSKRGLFWGAYDGDGNAIVRRRVQIKGMKPRSPFGQAVAEFLPRYIEIIQQELAREAEAAAPSASTRRRDERGRFI